MPAEPAIVVDRSGWPIVEIRFPARVGDDELRAYLEELARLADARERYATLSDLRAMRAPLTARQRWVFDEWMRRNERALSMVAVANALVAPSPLARGIARTAYGRSEPPRHRLFDDPGDARRWCEHRLRRAAGAPRPRAVPARVPPPVPAGPAAAGVIDLFREPAFLVDAAGAVVFANRAAHAAFAPPWPVVAATLSDARGDSPVSARVVSLDGDAGELRLVVVDEGAALADLPPSLRRIAAALARGASDKEIAARAGLSVATVRTYVRRLYARAGVHDRRALMRLWIGER